MNSLEELKAVDTKILSLKDISSFTDIMIITSGTSSRHMSAYFRQNSREPQGKIDSNYLSGRKRFKRMGVIGFRRYCSQHNV
jgi:ribosomal silencing factor RsfS